MIAWHSTRQDLTSESTCEAELIGASSAVKRARPLQLLVQELTRKPVNFVLGVDNLPSIRQLQMGVLCPYRTRHLSIRGHRISESLENGDMELYHVGTADIPPDHLTKALSARDVEDAKQKFGMVDL